MGLDSSHGFGVSWGATFGPSPWLGESGLLMRPDDDKRDGTCQNLGPLTQTSFRTDFQCCCVELLQWLHPPARVCGLKRCCRLHAACSTCAHPSSLPPTTTPRPFETCSATCSDVVVIMQSISRIAAFAVRRSVFAAVRSSACSAAPAAFKAIPRTFPVAAAPVRFFSGGHG
jgi:hypothetical protein